MFNLKNAKSLARKTVKRNYAVLFVATLIFGLVTTRYSYTLLNINFRNISYFINNHSLETVSISNIIDNVKSLFFNNTYFQNSFITPVNIIESSVSGMFVSIILYLFIGIRQIKILLNIILLTISSVKIEETIIIVLSGFLILLLVTIIQNSYRIAIKRIFMEARLYQKIKTDRFVFLFAVKKLYKPIKTLIICDLLKLITLPTLYGGISVSYSLMMVPYILCENPDIDTFEAISLSKRMMYGHRYEAFKIDLSLLGHLVLSGLTFGLSSVLYSNMYREAIFAEYYAYLRQNAKDIKISYYDRINDDYLVNVVSKDYLDNKYIPVIENLTSSLDIRKSKHTGLRGFVENNLGHVYKNDADEKLYDESILQNELIEEYKRVLDQKQYPDELSSLFIQNKISYLRRNTVINNFLITFILIVLSTLVMIGYRYSLKGLLNINVISLVVKISLLCMLFMVTETLLYKSKRKPSLYIFLFIVLLTTCDLLLCYLYPTFAWINNFNRVSLFNLVLVITAILFLTYILVPTFDNALRKMNKYLRIFICLLVLIAIGLAVYYVLFI